MGGRQYFFSKALYRELILYEKCTFATLPMMATTPDLKGEGLEVLGLPKKIVFSHKPYMHTVAGKRWIQGCLCLSLNNLDLGGLSSLDSSGLGPAHVRPLFLLHDIVLTSTSECARRWSDTLDPRIDKSPWTPEQVLDSMWPGS